MEKFFHEEKKYILIQTKKNQKFIKKTDQEFIVELIN